MKVLFTISTMPLSKAIRAATGEPVSHVAIAHEGVILHADLRGVHLVLRSDFDRAHQTLFAVEIDATNAHFLEVLAVCDRSLYDFGALLFDAFSLLARKYLKLPLPKTNLWRSSGMFLCTEIATKLLFGEEDSEITPYGLYLKLSGLRAETLQQTSPGG